MCGRVHPFACACYNWQGGTSVCFYYESSSESSQWELCLQREPVQLCQRNQINKDGALKKKKKKWSCQRNKDSMFRPNEIGNTNTEGVSWRSHAGVMILRPGLYQFQPISDRCLLRLSGQRLRLSTQHISFRLVGAIKVGGGRSLVYYIEVCLKHSTHECFQASFIQPAVFNWKYQLQYTVSKGISFSKFLNPCLCSPFGNCMFIQIPIKKSENELKASRNGIHPTHVTI